MSDSTSINCADGNLCQRNQEIKTLSDEVDRLSQLVNTDPLTHLFNYRHFSQVLSQEIERSQRTLQATTLIMVDIDHFKRVNDEWGHEKGNDALCLIAQCIIDNVRKLDIACRYGGEEFAIILPSTDIVTGARVAERIRQSIENSPLEVTLKDGSASHITLTASAGLSVYDGTKDPASGSLIEAADEQLYAAKEQGRNRVCFNKPEDEKDQQVSTAEKEALSMLFNNR
ncbi:GGDEF domain-containing protein [Eionea flava]